MSNKLVDAAHARREFTICTAKVQKIFGICKRLRVFFHYKLLFSANFRRNFALANQNE